MDKEFIKNPVEAYEKLKEENKSLKESLKLISQTLNHTLQSEVDLYKRQIDNSVPDDWEYEEVLALVEEYIEKLKAEIEKLKEEKQGLIKDWEEKKNLAYEIACKNEKLKAENEKLKKVSCKFKNYCTCNTEKFIQSLTEIKEIAEEDCKQCFEIDGFSKPDDCGICPYNKILQKISEVIDD